MKRNIALFVGKLTGGGAERAVGRLSIALSDFYNVFVFVYNTEAIDYNYSGKLIDLSNKAKSFPMMAIKSALNINKVIQENSIELVISFLDFPNIINGLFNHSCKKLVSIRVYYEHGHLYTNRDKIKYPFVKRAIEASDGTLTLSHWQKAIIERDMRVKEKTVYVVKNIFDDEEILQKASLSPDNKEITEFINQYTTVALGRLDFQKNYKKLLDIFKIVLNEIPQARLLILGSGYMEKDLKSYGMELGIADNILLAGRVSNPFPYLARSSVYVSLSRFEGFPNSLVEAMVCGVPVMHSNCPTGPAEILLEGDLGEDIELPLQGDYGILFPLFEPGVFDDSQSERDAQIKCSEIWCKLLQNKDFNSLYSEKAKERAKKYTPQKCIPNYVNIINKTLEG